MKITLVYPSMGERMRGIQSEPLTMTILAGLTPPEIPLSFWDDRIEEIPYDEPTDLVAISVQTFTAKRAYEIASEFRRRHVPVVLGGIHVSFLPEEGLKYADAVVVGEAEELWPRVLSDAAQGRLQRVYRSERLASLKGLIYRREIFHGKRYIPASLVEFGRGCPSACTFCSVSAFFHRQKRCRPVSEVVDEIRRLPRKNITFIDDNVIGDPERARELFEAIIPLKKRWTGQCSIEIADDDDLLRLAADSGCNGLLVGFESLDDRNLRQMGKSVAYNRHNYDRAIHKLHEHGIKICASFLFGYDHDTGDAFASTVEFALQKKFYLALFCQLTPFPGTAFYKLLQSQNRLSSDAWWLSPGAHWGDVVYAPKNYSKSALSEGCRQIRRAFYGRANIFRRMLLKANARTLGVSLFMNAVVRREVFEKQGFLLGRGPSQSRIRADGALQEAL